MVDPVSLEPVLPGLRSPLSAGVCSSAVSVSEYLFVTVETVSVVLVSVVAVADVEVEVLVVTLVSVLDVLVSVAVVRVVEVRVVVVHSPSAKDAGDPSHWLHLWSRVLVAAIRTYWPATHGVIGVHSRSV